MQRYLFTVFVLVLMCAVRPETVITTENPKCAFTKDIDMKDKNIDRCKSRCKNFSSEAVLVTDRLDEIKIYRYCDLSQQMSVDLTIDEDIIYSPITTI